MTTNKDLLMQPLSDEELADVTGGTAKRSRSECESVCARQQKLAPAVYAQCMAKCISGRDVQMYR